MQAEPKGQRQSQCVNAVPVKPGKEGDTELSAPLDSNQTLPR